jgi:hypothetical protein
VYFQSVADHKTTLLSAGGLASPDFAPRPPRSAKQIVIIFSFGEFKYRSSDFGSAVCRTNPISGVGLSLRNEPDFV